MPKTIKVEWNAEDVAEIYAEWMGRSISKADAERIISKIKRRAEEAIARDGFSVISKLIEEF